MLVVTDTTPLNYLVLIAQVDTMAALFGSVIIPQAVADELRHPRAPELVQQWIAAPPAWCSIQSPQGTLDTALASLGRGEREAMALCREVGADALLTDDTQAWREARARGIEVIRTLDFLERASLRGLLDLPTALARLQATTFYAPAPVISDMLARHAAKQPGRSLRPPEP